MPTSTQLKTTIDTALNNSVADSSITPAIVATQIKSVVDYVDQEVVSKTKKITITHEELLALNTTPKELLPAISGKAYVLTHVHLKYNDNDGWTTAGSPWVFKLDSSTVLSLTVQIGGSTIKEQQRVFPTDASTSDTFFNKAVTVNSSADLDVPVNPLTTCDVYITYFTINQ